MKTLTTTDVALRLSFTPKTIRRWMETGYLPGTKINGRWYTTESELQARLQSFSNGASRSVSHG